MKNITTILLLAITLSASAQTSRPTYCDLLASNFWGGRNVYITLDLGALGYGSILDEDNTAHKFKGVVDALNYMARLGWSVKREYYLTEEKQKVLHFLLEKQITDDSQITEGIHIKQTEPKERKTHKPGANGDDIY